MAERTPRGLPRERERGSRRRDDRGGARGGPPRIVLLNKPYGVVCRFTPEAGHRSLAELVPVPGVYPIGRLDADSEGLVVLSDDGALQARIADASQGVGKAYWVQVEGEPGEAELEALRRGVALRDGTTAPARVRVIDAPPLWPRDPPIRVRRAIPTTWLDITLGEGRNRQLRRMTAAVGYPTLRLVRHRVASWTLDGLAPGEHRVL